MIDRNAPTWGELHSAGNDADKWLWHLLDADGDFQENMEILAEDLSHQLSYYSATAYVLPHLAALCSRLSLEEKVFLTARIGCSHCRGIRMAAFSGHRSLPGISGGFGGPEPGVEKPNRRPAYGCAAKR